MNRSPFLFSAFLASALLAVLLLTACGGGEPAAAPAGAPPTSATPSPDRSAPTAATAADGRDLNACRDGECEVVVEAGDVLRFDGGLGTDPLTVVSSGATFTITDQSGFTASISGGGTVQTGSVRIEAGESERERTAIRVSPRD